MKKKKDEDLFEDLGFEDQFDSDEESHDDYHDPHLLDASEDEDPAELARRRHDYSKLRKNDKIFNNSYNLGQDSTDEFEQTPHYSDIKIDSSSPDYHMYDKDHYGNHIDDKIIQRDIDAFINRSPEIQAILGNDPDKKKYAKAEINELFSIILGAISKGENFSIFINPVHVLDSISSLTGMEYKKLFDQLTYEHKEVLLLELNKKYGFLDKPSKNLKMF